MTLPISHPLVSIPSLIRQLIFHERGFGERVLDREHWVYAVCVSAFLSSCLKWLSSLPSYIKFRKFKYFKAILRRNKTCSTFRHLFNGGRIREFKANFPPYWFQKGATDRLGTSKLVTSNRYLTLESLIVISYCNMRNMPDRCVVRCCSAYPDQKTRPDQCRRV